MDIDYIEKAIFNIRDTLSFEEIALGIFKFQYENNIIYKNYIQYLNLIPSNINSLNKIPFLPISLFRTQKIMTGDFIPELVFKSSGTTDMAQRSMHLVKDHDIYEKSFLKSFEQFYGDIKNYCILALLPSYFENKNSSLIYMINCLIEKSQNSDSGFYLYNTSELHSKLLELENKNQKTILFGVSFALIDFADEFPIQLKNTILVETGGTKGMKNDLTKDELHNLLINKFGVSSVHSEYGMTELLSQAYSKGNGLFYSSPWLKIFIREINDPFNLAINEQTGGINIIDLANIYSCSFIETQDLGRKNNDGSFEVLGRFDNSDLRGCNLLIG